MRMSTANYIKIKSNHLLIFIDFVDLIHGVLFSLEAAVNQVGQGLEFPKPAQSEITWGQINQTTIRIFVISIKIFVALSNNHQHICLLCQRLLIVYSEHN